MSNGEQSKSIKKVLVLGLKKGMSALKVKFPDCEAALTKKLLLPESVSRSEFEGTFIQAISPGQFPVGLKVKSTVEAGLQLALQR